ncbi:putative DNA-binding transcriptional regulator YafY [Kribbella orskensis]|uniref:DNA-binding transcriptional regulator YafY n=1 Tax=Kribbella orskensis TaxID=2512216 RepID=A0ABY2BA12_9ACTN|nr:MULTISPECIES: YafY family protein [Kribbella]TCN32897.1 putative DNA-binding transcriptional regulator YafY [Kribbella sp. VKM Ac-2500]TCO13229.1 putative DNA-binding transcriptional regulator YafY [Kribbella orskensis]
MIETSGRLLKLLSLLQSQRDWTGLQLAERLDVTVRTVRRDVDKLRNLGYPVNATLGVAGGYQLGAGAQLPPLLLDDEEAVAVAVGLRTAAGGTVAGIAETSLRALAKLEQVLPSRLRHRVNSLQQMTIPLVGGAPTVDPEVLTAVAAVCRDHQRLRFDYHDKVGASTVRTTEPHRLVHTGRRWYLVAWDIDREDWRTFRVDRMSPRIPTGPRFKARELSDEDVARLTSTSISTSVYRVQGRFVVHSPAAQVHEVVPPTAGVVEPIDDRTCRLIVGSPSLEQLAVWIALLGFDFDIEEPAELHNVIRPIVTRLNRASPPAPT